MNHLHTLFRLTCLPTLLLTAVALGIFAPSACAQVINVEIDWMSDGLHTHKPTASEIAAVAQMFACHGWTLNAVIDDSIPEAAFFPDGPDSFDFFTWVGTNSFRSFRDQYFDNNGPGWHYCIFGHQYIPEFGTVPSGSSGYASPNGIDFIVTLGTFTAQVGTPWDRAGTFAHELGHNLGLSHTATDESVTGPFSPNYASVMSYQYQLAGVRNGLSCLNLTDSTSLFKNLDYSNGRLQTLDENAMDEAVGVGIRGTDWNCSGTVAGVVAQDLNGRPWCAANGPRTFLYDRNDWAVIHDITFGKEPPPPSMQIEPCISSDEWQTFLDQNKSMSVAQPTPTNEPCVSAQMYWVNSGFFGSETGAGATPFNTLLEAYNPAPTGSVVYLQPGNYDTGGSVITLSKPITFAGPGGATITK